MPVINSAHILSKINLELFDNGLYWIGAPVSAASSNIDRSSIQSALGLGPLQRLHYKAGNDISLDVSTIIAKHSNTISGIKRAPFNAFEYYMGLADNGVILAQKNKPVLVSFSLKLVPNAPISGTFSNRILEPDTNVVDFIQHSEFPEGIGTGTEVFVFPNEELPVMSGAQFFPGVTEVSITSAISLVEIARPGGIFGYYYGQPFNIDMSIRTYENAFESFHQYFMDVTNLHSISVGPFTVPRCKMISYSSSVAVGSYKQVDIRMVGKNFTYSGE